MNEGFLAAAGLSALWTGVHVIAGGRDVAAPLLRAPLSEAQKFTAYFAWHMASLSLAALAAGFLWAALRPEAAEVGAAATVLSAGYALLGLGMGRLPAGRFRDLPQGWLFVPVAALGALGLFGTGPA
ncbi:MAG: hypothetical protein AAFU61_11040 [Pseudomonadota bacterium]